MKLARVILTIGVGLQVACNNSTDEGPVTANRLENVKLIPFEYSEGQILNQCENAIQKAQTRIQDFTKMAANDRSFERTVVELDRILGDFNDTVQKLTFMKDVSTNAIARKEGADCEVQVAKFGTSVYSNPTLYKIVDQAKVSTVQQGELRKLLLIDFKKSGVLLTEDKRASVTAMYEELSEHATKFSENLNADKSKLLFTKEELIGVPEDFVASLPVDADSEKYIVNVTADKRSRILETAQNPVTRQRMAVAWDNRAATTNTEILESALRLRQGIAKAFGYANWFDFKVEGRLAPNAKAVEGFLSGLRKRLEPKLAGDYAVLLAAKKQDDPEAVQIDPWDVGYYETKIKKEKYNIDKEKLREYFPRDYVIDRMFEIYTNIFGVIITHIPNASVWHPTVKLYSVKERSNGRIIGHFYLDLEPRDDKFGHAAAFPLILGRVLSNGTYQTPVAAMVANFTEPLGDKPSLLSHDEVKTLFHEFGHIMHQVLTKSPYALTSGSNTKLDFVEAPSQMLENWVWDKKMLSKISGHYLNPNQKLPEDMIDQLIALKSFNQGYVYSRQVMIASFDLMIHNKDNVDVTETYKEVYKTVLNLEPVPNTHMPASFGHMLGGYDAGYYGYLWSEVYAADMYTVFNAAGAEDEVTGMSYRRNILEPGGTENPLEMLGRFLDREPTQDAFFKALGI